jgi:hypothetical protein
MIAYSKLDGSTSSTNPIDTVDPNFMFRYFCDLIWKVDADGLQVALSVHRPTAEFTQRLIDVVNINDNTTDEVMSVLADYPCQLRTAGDFVNATKREDWDAAASIIIQMPTAYIHAVRLIDEYLRGESTIAQRLLQFSANQGNPILTQFLLERGLVAVDARDGEIQYTPLHTASVNGNVQVVEHLLDHGARPSITDARARTPLQLIEEYCRMGLDVFARIRELLTTHTK